MKKGLGTCLLCMLVWLPVMASAETKTTELTAEIPSTYTLTIPATTKNITANQELTELGTLKVVGSLEMGKKVIITTTKNELTNQTNPNAKIPFELVNSGDKAPWSQGEWDEAEVTQGKEIPLSVNISKINWDNAKAGQYKGSIVFTSEVK